jgi:hypothetical protein
MAVTLQTLGYHLVLNELVRQINQFFEGLATFTSQALEAGTREPLGDVGH